MKVSIDQSKKLVITAKDYCEYQLISEWYCSALRQYKHNDGSEGFVAGINIDSIIINNGDKNVHSN